MHWKTKVKIAGSLIGVILMVILIVQNSAPYTLTFLFWAFELPGAVVIGLTFAIGVAVGLALSFMLARRHRKAEDQSEEEREES